MDQKQLRVFIAAAETQTFAGAARRIHMTQQNASRLVKLLEDELGVRLFERTPRGLTVTSAGTLLLEDAQRIIALTEKARQRARHAAGLEHERIRVGFPKHGTWICAPDLIRTFKRLEPLVALEFHEISAEVRINAVVEFELDLAFIFSPADDKPNLHPSLAADQLSIEPVCAVMPGSHALARLDAVPLQLLAGQQIIRWERRTNPAVFDRVIAACREAGFEPSFTSYIPEAISRDTLLPLIENGTSLSLTFRSFMDCSNWPGVASRLIDSSDLLFAFWLVYRRDDRSRPLKDLVRVAREIAGRYRSTVQGKKR